MPLEIVRNDITRMKVDAIVNAANNSLLGGGGVDGAIHRAAGPDLLEECRKLNGCPTGMAKITKAYRLPARYVIHTVGPVWQGGTRGERELLVSCYRSSLALAAEYECETVAFPMISAGVYGYPKDLAMQVAVETITDFLLKYDMTVFLVVFGHEEFITGTKLFRNVREYIDDAYADRHILRRQQSARESIWQRDPEAALAMEAQIMEEKSLHHAPASLPSSVPYPDWDRILKQTDESFSKALLRLIDEKGMTDAECYKKANVDRKLFSKIRSNPDYRPSKPTALAFAIALELNYRETESLIRKAGFALTRSSRFDLVVGYFIRNACYRISEINMILFELDLPLLGSGANVA